MKLKRNNLTFRKDNWPDKTYRAKTTSRMYRVDHNGSEWRLMIWENRALADVRYSATASELMEAADNHAAENKETNR